ncbi:hypothetical protein TIFTF001_042237 [Ficus carica]|uniref:Uncharacterized protein n=1 Tax=Ficus carica TaxID=3494 RepID=A0AA87ZFU5_FICCA|nr:hypothetical protein TIFTF001_042237 [Ficus carica]
MKKVYRGWKFLQVQTGLGYDPATNRVDCSDETCQSFINIHSECKHLRYEGLRNKELYYNVFDKTHAAGASGYGLVTMGGDNTPYVDYDFNFDNSGTHPFDMEDPTPSTDGQQASTRRRPDIAGLSRSRGSAGKRKQRDATDEMNFSAMQEIAHYFQGQSQSGGGSEQSVEKDGILQCMNIMKGMGIPPHIRTMMRHYFAAHLQIHGPFCGLDDEDRRDIIDSVVNPQPPPAH